MYNTWVGRNSPGRVQERMRENMEKLSQEIERLKAHFDAIDQEREKAYAQARDLRRISVKLVRDIQRGADVDAAAVLADCRKKAKALTEMNARYGFIEEALQEYAEAALTDALLNGTPVPVVVDLDCSERSYLLGLADAISEFRRRVLTLLRKGDTEAATKLFDLMDELFHLISVFDHTDAVLPLRRKQDQLRAVLERTRADLTNTICQKRLEDKIRLAAE